MTLGGCFRLLRKSRINAMRKRRRRNTFFHYLLALYVVILTFGDIKNVEARLRIVTSGRNRGINLIERESKRITSRQLDGNQFIREVSNVDSNTTASSATNRTHPKASEIANKAAIEAKAASDAQILAGRQAAHQVKVQLANKAAQSAKAAEAALAGKVALIEQLEDEARETQVVFKEGTLELERVRENTDAALKVVNSSRQKRKSTNIARNAAEQAKAASDAQNVAAAQASRQVKAQLAERAEMAAKAAEAALAGKETLVAQLQQELREAEAVVQEETASLNQTKIHTSSSHLTQDDEREQLKLLNQALQMVSGNIQISDRAAQGAQFELMEKEQLMEAAKRRLDQLTRRLKIAQKDLDNTKTLVMKANAAARDARLNAERNKRLSDSTS